MCKLDYYCVYVEGWEEKEKDLGMYTEHMYRAHKTAMFTSFHRF